MQIPATVLKISKSPLLLLRQKKYGKEKAIKEADRRKEFLFSFCEHSVDSSVVIRLEVNFDPEYVMRNIVAVQHNHSTLEMTTYHSKYPLDSIILNER